MGISYGSIIGAAGSIIGGIIGGYFGGPWGAAAGSTLGGMLGGLAGTYFFPPSMEHNTPPPPKPRETAAQFSTYGEMIRIVYEKSRLAGNVIYMQDVVRDRDRDEFRVEGERFHEVTILYTATFAVAFCEGPVQGISRIWVNNKLFADYRDPSSPYYPTGSTGLVFANLETTIARSATYFQVYLGSEDQTADPTLVSILGESETPAYRGICYIVFKDFPVGEYSGVPTIEIEVGPTVDPVDFTEWSTTGSPTVTEDETLFDLTKGAILVNQTASPVAAGTTYNSFEIIWEWELEEITGSFYPDVDWNYAYCDLVNFDYAPANAITARIGTNGSGDYVFSLKMTAGAATVTDQSREYHNLPLRRTLRLSRSGTTCTLRIYDGSELEDTVSVSHADFTHTDLHNFTFGVMIRGSAGDHMKLYLRDVQYSDQSVSATYGTALSDVVTSICEKVSVGSSLIDVSDLASDVVVGYTIPRQMPAKSALELLMVVYNFDVAEVDWKIFFKKRGGSSVATISADELRRYPYGESAPDRMIETRTQDVELPTHLTISYESAARDYQIATQHAVRIDKQIITHKSEQFGICLSDQSAKRVAEVLLKRIWMNRHLYAFSTDYKYLKLAPADRVTVSGKTMTVVEMSDRGGVIDFVCQSEGSGVYESSAISDDLSIDVINMEDESYIPSFIGIDIPAINDDAPSYGLTFAMYGLSGHYSGGILHRSVDGGSTWSNVAVFNSTSGVVGTCSTALGNVSVSDYTGLDSTSSLTVNLEVSDGAIDDDVYDLASGLAIVGSETLGYEIVHFANYSLVSGNTYTLTNFRRGLYGTASKISGHVSGETFILVTVGYGLDFVSCRRSQVGETYLFRARNYSGSTGDIYSYTMGDLLKQLTLTVRKAVHKQKANKLTLP